jgi:hypothetical protein
MILAGDIPDARTVAISATKAGVTIDGRVVGKGRVVEDDDSDEASTVVRFPKGA